MTKDRTAKVQIPIKLHPGQRSVKDNPARFKVVATGCRWGKTEFGLEELLDNAGKRPGTKNWIIFPTAVQGRSILWNRLISFIPPELISGRPNKTRMDVKLVNGSEIGIRGSDNEQSLRGEKLGFIIQDEAAFQKPHVWEEILRPRLVDLKGGALFISSPFGKNWFYKLWEHAHKGKDKEWAAWHFTTYDNPYIDKAELDKLRISTPSRIWKREYMGQFLDDEGLVYGEFATKNIFNSSEKYLGHESTDECGRGIDWGMWDETSCIFVHVHGNDLLVSAEHSQGGWDVDKHAAVIRSMSEGRNIPAGLTVLDESAFGHKESTSSSVAILFSQNGIDCARSERGKDTGISIMKQLLEGKEGEPRLMVSDKCPRTIKALQTWEFGKHEPDCLAALRYIITHLHKLGKFKVMNVHHNNTIVAEERPLNPMNIFDRPKIKELNGEYRDLGWSDEGVPDY